MSGKRGFASMDREQQRAIARKGGQAAHKAGTAHKFDRNEARRAGKKGGQAVARDRKHMAAIGKKGGVARGLAMKEVAANAANEAAVVAPSVEAASLSLPEDQAS